MNGRAVAFIYAILGSFAIGAVFVQIAGAHPLTAESYPARLLGAQTTQHVFTIEGGMTAKCPAAEFAGEITAATGKVELSAEYHGSGESKCSAFGLGGTASISMNGCAYLLRPQEELKENEFQGLMDIACPEGQKIVITSGTCEVQIGSQERLGPVKYLNDPSGEAHKDTVTFKPEVKGTLRYNKSKDGSGCPLNGTGEKTDGSYEGNTSLAGSNPATKAPLDLAFAVVTPALEAGAYPTELVGQQVGEHVFTFEAGLPMECPEAIFSGELPGPSTGIPLGAEYKSSTNVCHVTKSSAGTLTMNGCRYRLHVGAETGEGKFSGEADLDCPAGAAIVITIATSSCELQIGDQTAAGVPINQGLGPVTFVNEPKAEPEKDQVKISFEFIEEISYENKKDGFGCPLSGTGPRSGGSYVGTFTLRGYAPATKGEKGEKITGEPHDLYVAP